MNYYSQSYKNIYQFHDRHSFQVSYINFLIYKLIEITDSTLC